MLLLLWQQISIFGTCLSLLIWLHTLNSCHMVMEIWNSWEISTMLLLTCCILYTKYQNTVAFNQNIVLFWKIQFLLDFICATIVHLLCCTPYASNIIKELNRLEIQISTFDYHQHQPASNIIHKPEPQCNWTLSQARPLHDSFTSGIGLLLQ